LKGGKVPLEVLVRGKDAEANEKLFVKINDSIKAAGVSHTRSPDLLPDGYEKAALVIADFE